jgi:hypothetical protein
MVSGQHGHLRPANHQLLQRIRLVGRAVPPQQYLLYKRCNQNLRHLLQRPTESNMTCNRRRSTQSDNTSDSQSQRLSVPAHTPHPTMAPPQALSRPASGSPHPNGFLGGPPSATYTNQYHPPPNHYVPPVTTQFDHYRKTPLKSKPRNSLWITHD